jgi:hypothetical protein
VGKDRRRLQAFQSRDDLVLLQVDHGLPNGPNRGLPIAPNRGL